MVVVVGFVLAVQSCTKVSSNNCSQSRTHCTLSKKGGGALSPQELAGVFGRAMVTATESDISATVLAGFSKEKDEQLAERVEAQRRHAREVGGLLKTVRRAEAAAAEKAATARGAATTEMGRR